MDDDHRRSCASRSSGMWAFAQPVSHRSAPDWPAFSPSANPQSLSTIRGKPTSSENATATGWKQADHYCLPKKKKKKQLEIIRAELNCSGHCGASNDRDFFFTGLRDPLPNWRFIPSRLSLSLLGPSMYRSRRPSYTSVARLRRSSASSCASTRVCLVLSLRTAPANARGFCFCKPPLVPGASKPICLSTN